MVSSGKRGRQEMEVADPPQKLSMAQRIRDMWEFANLAQWIYTFGKAVKIDEDLDIEDLEAECMKTHSTVLSDIGLALLKFVSSHRGLTPEIFDEYTRRQYLAKAPQRNPYGIEEEPAKFAEFDAFTKIRVLQQLTQWTMVNPDRIRERMEEQKDSEQTIWRIEPFGWDSEDRTYIVLDDNRLYRQTAPPPPPPPAPVLKKSSKKAKAALRASKRRKISEPPASDVEVANDQPDEDIKAEVEEYDGFGGMKWECLAVTLDDLNKFIASIEKSRDPNEKILRSRISEDLLPLLEKQEEARKRKVAQKERELLNLEKLATAKRSSRIAGKIEQQRQGEEAKEAERKKLAELAMAKKEQEKWIKLEKERESRMMTREQRLKEREARRILHEEELAGLSEDSKKLEAGESRLSERHLKAEIERKKQALEELAEDDWVFDCICGAYGQIDDGSHSISCEKCNIWQHTKCVGISEAAASRDDFHFVCQTCKRRVKEVERTKHRPTIKLKVNRPTSSSSPVPSPPSNAIGSSISANKNDSPQGSPEKPRRMSYSSTPKPEYASPYLHTWVPSLKAQSPNSNATNVVPSPTPKSDAGPMRQDAADPIKWSPNTNGSLPRPQFQSTPQSNGGHAFSSPHPHSPISLPPPSQGRNYSFVNGQTSSIPRTRDPKYLSRQDKPSTSQRHPNSSPDSVFSTRPSGQNFPPTPSPHNSQLHQNLYEPIAPLRQGHNGQNQSNGTYPHTKASVRLSSPLSAAAAMAPPPYYKESAPSPKAQSQATPRDAIELPPMQLNSQSTVTVPAQSTILGPTYVSAPPLDRTGISPVKHSPPRPASASGFAPFGSATPSVLPPVASLPPDQQQPNLTPPIKMAEPERNKLHVPFTAAP